MHPGSIAARNGLSEAVNRVYVYSLSAVAALAGLLFGFDTAVINGALVFLRQDFRLTDTQTEIAASALLVGCLIGSAGAGALADRYGRRKSLIGSAVLFCISSLWTALPRTLGEFSAARLVAGLAIGVASVLAPMYIAEIAPAGLRGRLVTLNQMAIVSGILLSYFVNWKLAALGASSWRWMFASAAAPSLAFLAALLFIPESPRWLVRGGRGDEARAILARISGDGAALRQMSEIRASLATESGSLRELFEPRLRRPLKVAVLLAVLSQVTGINTVIYYGSILFKEHGGRGAADALGANVMIGGVNFLCTIVAIALIDRLGRKPLLLAGSAGMGISLVLVAAAFQVQPLPANLVLGAVLAYVACFAVSLGPGSWVYISELFPTAVRGRAMSIATLALWAACTLVTFTFLTLLHVLGPAGAFLVYAGFCGVTFLFVWRSTPETKGRTLEEICGSW
ncbi:MAG: sugar porter family MFS transporter [Acidobacteria bacterium]|nr:sugar porter family MFS transporter [Acidobacteriota bacterium]